MLNPLNPPRVLLSQMRLRRLVDGMEAAPGPYAVAQLHRVPRHTPQGAPRRRGKAVQVDSPIMLTLC